MVETLAAPGVMAAFLDLVVPMGVITLVALLIRSLLDVVRWHARRTADARARRATVVRANVLRGQR